MRKYLISIPLIFSLGCMTAYKGPAPDLDLHGEKAEKEIQKFHLEDSYWAQGMFFEMGPEKTKYTIDSLRPMVSKISPDAEGSIQRAHQWWIAQTVALGFAIAFLAADLTTNHVPTQNALASLSIASSLTSIGISFIWPGIHADAAREFNRDLEQKFKAPLVGYRAEF